MHPCSIALVGHTGKHFPQEIHFCVSITAFPSLSEIALTGQMLTQRLHPIHFSLLTFGISIFPYSLFFINGHCDSKAFLSNTALINSLQVLKPHFPQFKLGIRFFKLLAFE